MCGVYASVCACACEERNPYTSVCRAVSGIVLLRRAAIALRLHVGALGLVVIAHARVPSENGNVLPGARVPVGVIVAFLWVERGGKKRLN